MPAVRDRKRKMVDGLVAAHLAKYRKSGAELVMGQGRFVAPKTIEVALNAGGTPDAPRQDRRDRHRVAFPDR